MTPENNSIPDWAQQERQRDLDWINENLEIFWMASSLAFEDVGRGAIVVDATSQPITDASRFFGYFLRDQIEEMGNEDTKRMVAEYDPTHELVLVLLKSGDRTSTYRIRAAQPESHEDAAQEFLPSQAVEPPSVETLMEWDAEGGCEAACPHGCWVEPDGTCPHGNPSWLLKLGLI